MVQNFKFYLWNQLTEINFSSWFISGGFRISVDVPVNLDHQELRKDVLRKGCY
jgi:hypothetical protein